MIPLGLPLIGNALSSVSNRSNGIFRMSGWIKVHRKLMETQGYFSEPFCRNMAWIDLLLLANHKEDFFRVRGVKVTVLRGQIGYTEEALAARWKWSRGKVRRFIFDLKNEHKIVQLKTSVTTLLSIVKYDEYQGGGTADGTPNGTTDGHQTVQQTDTNKKVKNIKNDKKNIAADAADWQEWVDEWFLFYERMVGVKPQFNGPEAKGLKDIKSHLKDIEAWRTILQTWDSQDDWIRDKLELRLISSKINQVLVNAKKGIDDTNFRGNSKSQRERKQEAYELWGSNFTARGE